MTDSDGNTLTGNTALNCTAGYTWVSSINNDFTGSGEANFLRMNVTDVMGFPISDVDVEVVTDGMQVYATPYFGGLDSTTDLNGVTPWIAVIYRTFTTNDTMTVNTTTVTVYYMGHIFTYNPRTVNISTSHMETVLMDDTPPETTIILSGTQALEGWYVSDVMVNLTAIDYYTSVAITRYSFDEATWFNYTEPFNITDEGITTVYYYSIDIADNVEATKTETIKIDKMPPDIAITVPPSDGTVYTGWVVINGTFDDTGSQVTSIAINDSRFILVEPVGTGPYGYSGTYSFKALIIAEGEFVFEVTVWDQAGFTGTATRQLIFVNNTPIGEDVEVTDPVSGINMAFDNVTDSGTTTVTATEMGPDPPEGFVIIPSVTGDVYYDINTTANYMGTITIAIPYDETQLTYPWQESLLKLYHWNSTTEEWEDITTWVDTENNIIYGEVTGFSIFAIMESSILEQFQGYGRLRIDGQLYRGDATMAIYVDMIQIQVEGQTATWNILKQFRIGSIELVFGEGELGKIVLTIHRGETASHVVAAGRGIFFFGCI